MPVAVHVSTHVRSYTGGNADLSADGATVAEVLRDLDRRYPGLRFRIVDEQDRIRQHINVFVGQALVRDLGSPVTRGVDVHILGALSGG